MENTTSDRSAPSATGLNERELVTIAAAVDVVIPPDGWPGGWDGGTRTLLDEQLTGFLHWAVGPLQQAARELDAIAQQRGALSFAELDMPSREAAFAELLAAEAPSGGGVFGRGLSELGPLSVLATLAFEGFYGGTREPAGWAMVGYQPLPEGVVPVEPPTIMGISAGQLRDSYDVVIIGAGGGGGVAAAELTRAGMRVLLVERSRPMSNRELRNNHLQGKRAQLYDVTAGPGAGNPRVFEGPEGQIRLVDGAASGADWGLTAMTLGGGTRLWQAMAWRFMPEDFAMATTYGVPADSTLIDWPFGYDELAPYYDRVEHELGVAGAGFAPISLRTPRTRDYPMPPLADDVTRIAYTRAAERLGWNASPIPFAINSVPRDGRAACVRCSQCIGHACPVDAKNGTHNTFIPRALATGLCDLLMSAQATAVEHDGRGRASGVRLVVETPAGPVERTVRADRVVVAAGAMETPRLLQVSGLGNEWVGGNAHSHGLAMVIARSAPDVKTWAGPGHSVATFDFVHTDAAPWGGGVIFDLLPMYPVAQAQMGRMLDATFGPAHKQWMRDHPVSVGAMSMVQEIPHQASRVTADPQVRDRYGMPVARIRGVPHPASAEAADFIVQRCAEWIREVGGDDLLEITLGGGQPATEHCAGTARIGDDPALSACDPNGRLHGTSNVYVADASLHPTNGSVNPALTAMAMSMRVSHLLASNS
jgi:choline dehydrogenase-like flavoprotein